MDWFIYAALSAISFSVFSIITKKYLKKESDPEIFAFLFNIIGGIFLLGFIFFDKTFFDFSWQGIGRILLSSILYAAANLIFTVGRKLEEVSHVSIARQTATIWSFLAGVLVLGESFSLPNWPEF
jgi:drug/metabolite transporter (DMT)-like permease